MDIHNAPLLPETVLENLCRGTEQTKTKVDEKIGIFARLFGNRNRDAVKAITKHIAQLTNAIHKGNVDKHPDDKSNLIQEAVKNLKDALAALEKRRHGCKAEVAKAREDLRLLEGITLSNQWADNQLATTEMPNYNKEYLLGHYHFTRIEGKERGKAFQHFEDAAKHSLEAKLALAECYRHGIGTSADSTKAHQLTKEVAEQGLAVGKTTLGFYHKFGIGTEKDESKAFALFKEAAKQGEIEAILRQGECYLLGTGVKQNKSKAAKLFAKAAEQGNTEAMLHLANCYEDGNGVRKNEKKAFEWRQRAAEHADPKAMVALAQCYQHGIGVEEDVTSFLQWCQSAANFGSVEAKYLIGEHTAGINQNMRGVDTDVVRGYLPYVLAVTNGRNVDDTLLRLSQDKTPEGVKTKKEFEKVVGVIRSRIEKCEMNTQAKCKPLGIEA